MYQPVDFEKKWKQSESRNWSLLQKRWQGSLEGNCSDTNKLCDTFQNAAKNRANSLRCFSEIRWMIEPFQQHWGSLSFCETKRLPDRNYGQPAKAISMHLNVFSCQVRSGCCSFLVFLEAEVHVCWGVGCGGRTILNQRYKVTKSCWNLILSPVFSKARAPLASRWGTENKFAFWSSLLKKWIWSVSRLRPPWICKHAAKHFPSTQTRMCSSFWLDGVVSTSVMWRYDGRGF